MIKNNKISLYGMLIAVAFLLSYIESIFPLPMLVPGMKIGLANIVALFALYRMGAKEAAILSFIRILLVAFTFANLYSLLYSIAGAGLSLLMMMLLKRTGKFSIIGVSIVGAIMHNVGQILVAIMVIDSVNLVYILPILSLTGIGTGTIIGILAGIITKRFQYMENHTD
ncbi:Gx transporter family protein [Anaerosporobacter faecicola]|uniref:Gx transporter family protein n=1 Tax=Anaerosporobacter faecicola TaxID=2718714 RepID=UPI001EE62B0D|nr:Gx transporter family protein [Anaerosporobacter faecicola]